VPNAGRHEPVLDRFAEHLGAVRNRAPSTVANCRHYVACFLRWWSDEHDGAALAAVRADRHLALLFAPEAAGITSEIAGASDALFKANAEFMRPRLEAARDAGQLRPGLDLDEAAEWILRTILSLLTIKGPTDRNEAATRQYLATFLVPALASDPPPASPPPARRRRATPLQRG